MVDDPQDSQSGSPHPADMFATTDITKCENPAQVAARLFAGAGLPSLAARDHATFGDPGAIIHGRGIHGEAMVAIQPAAESGWRDHDPEADIPCILAVDDYAPLVDVRIHVADIRVHGWLRRYPQAERLPMREAFTGSVPEVLGRLPEWTNHLVYTVHPETVSVHCQAGSGEVPIPDISNTHIDTVAAHQFTVSQRLARGDFDWQRILKKHLSEGDQDVPFDVAATESVRLVSVDSQGLTVVAVHDNFGHPVRIPFPKPIAALHDVLWAVRQVTA